MSHTEFWLKRVGDSGALLEQEPYSSLVSADREGGGWLYCVFWWE